MGKIALEFFATLENVSEVKPIGDEFRWYLKLKCTNCGEESTSWQYVCVAENVNTKGGRGSASMVQKCKMCSRENHLDIIKDSVKSYKENDSDQFIAIIKFECRGLDVISWDVRSGWNVASSCSNAKFSDVDLSELEWYEYDENANETVSITDIKYKLTKLKK